MVPIVQTRAVMLRSLVLVSIVAGCLPPSTSPGVVYYVPAVPIVPLAAYPPAPFHHFSVGADSVYQARVPIQFETPSLAIRNLAMRISEAASHGDCATAKHAGDELEKVDADSHHAILAVDERYASCVRGF